MPAPNDLAATYSFIGPFLADSDLAPYGDNALPLFALGLYLGIEDLASFATDSLTDQPDDKKADVIYINESEGVACVAQGLTAGDWGKQEAPANKASDLNTAAAWLLQAPLGDVPETIRSHAKLLRDALEAKTISRLVFAYAHNAMESANVDAELQTLRHLVNGLEIVKEVEVSVVELGMRQIEALHLTSLGSIQVIDEVDLPASATIAENGTGWQAYVIPINGAILHALYEKYQHALFSANLRDFIGTRRVSGNVNNQIRNTVESNPGLFFVLNNGITLVTKKAVLDEKGLRVYGLSIVNGAQTTGAIHSSESRMPRMSRSLQESSLSMIQA